MTDISVTSTAYQVESRSWLIAQPGGIGFGYTPSITLDVSTFTAATHYANGYFPSGIALGKITASGKYGPYDATANDGRETCAGYLFSAVKVPNLLDLTVDAGAAMVAAFAVVDTAKLLAIVADSADGGGFWDSGASSDLPLILHV